MATANYVARRFGIRSAMSAAEALRRCPEAVFVRPRHSLYRQYSQAVWSAVGEVVPRVERTGIDEGYLDLGTVLTSFAGARRLAEAVQVAVRGATSLSCSLGVSTAKVVCKVASDRRKPGGITVVPPGREARFLAPLADARAARRRAARRGAAGGGGHRHDRRARGALRRRAPRRAAGPGRPAAPRPGARDRPARPRARRRADLDLDRGDVRARPHRPGGPPRRAAADGGRGRRRTCAATGSRPGP